MMVILTGVIQVIFGLLRLGTLTRFVSYSVSVGLLTGIAVLLISTELEEILTLAHRIAVIHRGRIVGEMSRAEVDVERLGMMMGGQAA